MDEINLIRLCQKGDSEAFDNLFKSYSKKALHTAYLISGSRHLAEEIVQESFIQCFKNINKLNDPQKFRSWFYRIIVRYSWKAISKEKNKDIDIEDDANICSAPDEVFNTIESLEIRKAVHRALDKLTLPLKTVVILYYFNGLSTKEISKTLNCMQGTVKSRLYNARKILGKELKQYKSLSEYGEECKINGLQKSN